MACVHKCVAYPSYYEQPAISLSKLLVGVYPYIDYSLNFPLRKVPIILYTDNMYSNGYVTWAPKREELAITPPVSTYALSWSKQLAVHEWRHVAQISSLRRGLTKIASWVMGEAGVSLGLAVTPRWILEGDATLAETQFAEYGRGLQPDFTIGYRAMFADGWSDMNRLDRWINGSYKRFYPNIYHFGYQTLSAADTYFGNRYFGEMMAYSGRWPIFIMPADIYMLRKHKTSFKKIAKQAFAELDSLWAPYADVEENFAQVTPINKRSYTTYTSPTEFQGSMIAVKRDFDTPNRIVNTGSGKKIKSVGSLSSPLVVRGDMIYFTEYVPHPIFEQVSFSAIRAYDVKRNSIKTYHKWSQNYGLTLYRDGFATISVDSLSRSFVRYFDKDFNEVGEHHFSENEFSLHSICWDNLSDALYFIALDERGMWIGSLGSDGSVNELYSPNVVSVANLRAKDGVLYFNSIQSGKDEIHSIELTSGQQFRVTTSRFGSYLSSLTTDSLLFTTYTSAGAMVASMPINTEPVDTVYWSRKPINLLNPKRNEWNVPKVDTIITAHTFQNAINDDLTPSQKRKKEREKRFTPSFAIHSWAPVGFDGDYFMADRPFDVALGATAFFQSTLSKFNGYATYGWLNNSNWLKGRVEYKGLPLTITLGAEYGGGSQSLNVINAPNNSFYVVNTPINPYFATDLTLSLPLNYSIGGFSRLLQPSFKVQYSNAKMYDVATNSSSTGLVQYNAGLWWSSTRYTAHRDIVPRWGYAIRANVQGGFKDDFSNQYSLFVRGYLPGVALNHSITLRAAAQFQEVNYYCYSNKALYLKGVNDNYITKYYGAAVADYTLPIVCPDWGWEGVLYLSRIYANLFGGYSTGSYKYTNGKFGRVNNYTYGVDLGVDFSLLRAYNQRVIFTFAMPNDKFYFGASYSMGF